MKNVYIAASPLQLISAIEARNRFKGNKHTFVVFLTNIPRQTSFIEAIVKMFITEDEIIYVDYKNKLSSAIGKMNLLKRLQKTRFDNAFVAHFAEFFMRLYICNLNYKSLFLLDDGTATLVYNKQLTEKVTCVRCSIKLAFKGVTKYIFLLKNRFNIERKVEINWFTMFDFNPSNDNIYIRHKFEYLKSKYINSTSVTANNKVYFIGPGLVHDNIVKSNDIYIELVKKIRTQYSQFEFIYLPHRLENLDDLVILTRDTDIQIVQFDNVLEVAFISNNIVPRHICSFYSTALYSLKLLYPQCKIDFMEIDKDYVNTQYVEVVTTIEEYYKTLFNSIKKLSE